MVHGKKRIPYWIDRRLTGLAGPDYDAIISFGLPFEPEDSQYGEYRLTSLLARATRHRNAVSMSTVLFLRLPIGVRVTTHGRRNTSDSPRLSPSCLFG